MANKKRKKRKKTQFYHPAPGTTIREMQIETAMQSEEKWFDYLNLHNITG